MIVKKIKGQNVFSNSKNMQAQVPSFKFQMTFGDLSCNASMGQGQLGQLLFKLSSTHTLTYSQNLFSFSQHPLLIIIYIILYIIIYNIIYII